MGHEDCYQPHKLIVGVLLASDADLMSVADRLEAVFGTPDLRSDPLPFDFTDYYDHEMGPAIRRQFVSFAELVDPGRLADLKRRSNGVEAEFARVDGMRRANLDPGILSLSRLILATTKPSGHRIPIGQGMHAEITLLFVHGHYRPLEWTYPDFRSGAYDEFLLTVRTRYHEQLNALDPDRAWRL